MSAPRNMQPILTGAELNFAPRVVLFPTDFSRACENAWPYALSLAKQHGAKLLLVHVLAPSIYAEVPPELMGAAQERARRNAEAQIAHLQQAHGGTEGLNCDVLLAEGDIGEMLFQFIDENHVDLVVVATRGRRDLKRLLLGSVAEKVFRQAPCPVLVIPERARPSDEYVIQRILCPVDFSADSPAALALSSAVARRYRAQLIVLHVHQDSPNRAAERERVVRSVEEQLTGLIEPCGDLPGGSHVEVAFGASVAKRISRIAVEYSCDLIVMAVHPAGEIVAHEQERNAYSIIRWSHCPVLAIPRSRLNVTRQ